MIKKIFPTEADLYNLSIKRTIAPIAPEKIDYRNVVVDKPWGYEYLLFENSLAAVWILFLKHGAKTSMHCHPRKKTSLLVLDGAVNTSSLDTHFALKIFDGLIIDRGVFHSTACSSKGGVFIMEVETPPDKADLVRLKDEYGRENQGYEGEGNISKDLHKYEHHSFESGISQKRKLIERTIRDCRVVFHANEDWQKFFSEIQTKNFCVVCFLDISIRNLNGQIIIEAGEVVDGKWLAEHFADFQDPKSQFEALTIH